MTGKVVEVENQILSIMDTTLRDGEQTSGVSFTDTEKLSVAKVLLESVGVDRIEIASARVSEGEFEAARRIMGWAAEQNFLNRVEILGFVDGKVSLDWIDRAGGKVINLLCKGSYKHVTQQLRKTPEEHLADIQRSVDYADELGIAVNVYLEDWSNGMRSSKDYVFQMVEELKKMNIQRIMLPDTLGILDPDETYEFCKEMIERFPDVQFDFHAHNDYDLAIANVFHAIKAGIRCVHTTVNGLGERAGNAPLSSVIATIKDHLKMATRVNESRLNRVSKLVETFSGIRIPTNKPLIGEFVFTQCSGVHADGDNKNNLYFNDLLPERFGRTRTYALGKTSGKANIKANLEEMGIELAPEALKMVTSRIIELGDRKETVTAEDLPYIVADVLQERIEQKILINNYSLSHAMGLKPSATVSIQVQGKNYEATASGDGQYDAFVNALKVIYKKLKKPFPKLVDYSVTIPPGGKTDALVETVIIWELEREFKTRGLDLDQTAAAIKATVRMLNLLEHTNA
ncbi:alpha-isopropylmalate synthase regulatory domain-containing protein [Sunxiuqinia elliptica]|uniref:D-citramalate synthase n=1 Tax=Sunxiuqinia elliptica TaxID=655355 RepID=A0A4R6HB75_9BACT|nr:alpha-isopropylmalate synthase regulatory domain-containing protein [Sunxiuqinia elliptica]TDO05257.1 D-citramalate synthase [Sunxiuqinia elliptica]TDO64806.1 D-citramalate synthase [Sunxiuqinia elliptica]